MDVGLLEAMISKGSDPAVLATVLETKGSAPRHAGSKMLISGGKPEMGTVGGGRGEAEAISSSRGLGPGESSVVRVEMTGMEATGPDMICGGVSRILVERPADLSPYGRCLAALRRGSRCLIAKRLSGSPPRAVAEAECVLPGDPPVPWARKDAQSAALATGKASFDPETGVFLDPFLPAERLVVAGAGHVAQALVAQAADLGFEILVCDERSDFATKERFPAASRVESGPYAETLSRFPLDLATYVVILSPSHSTDLECARAVMSREYRYAGLIGSARKTSMIVDQLVRDGVDPERARDLAAPIGAEIGAETPAEIAVSILAEIIARRRDAPMYEALRAGREARRAWKA